MAHRLRDDGLEVVVAAVGEEYRKLGDGMYCLDPGRYENYETLIRETGYPGNIVHLWTVTPARTEPSAPEFFERTQALGYYSLLYLAQALKKENDRESTRLIVVSSDTLDANGAETLCPEKATLLGPCLVMPQEHPNLNCRLIDIISHEAGRAELPDKIMGEIKADSSDRVAAYRGYQRLVPAYERVRLQDGAEAARSLRPQGVYLITGGLGNVGLLLAEYLARTVQARLILVGRSAFPARAEWEAWLGSHDAGDGVSRKIARLMALEESGAEVMVVSADVADEERMRMAFALGEKRFGEIHGVIHGAGVTKGKSIFRPLAEIGRDESEEQFRPKVHGLYVLERILTGKKLDFCLLLSSNASVLGGLGLGAYAAANSFMDAFAAERNKRGGIPWISANWDGWPREEGTSPARRTGIDDLVMTAGESVAAFGQVAAYAPSGQIVVSTGDLQARLDLWLRRQESTPAAEADTRYARPDLRTAYAAPRNAIEEVLAEIWAEALGIRQVSIHDNFFDLGVDSLLGVQIVAKANQAGVTITVRQIFEHQTIAELAAASATASPDRHADTHASASPPGERENTHGSDDRPETAPSLILERTKDLGGNAALAIKADAESPGDEGWSRALPLRMSYRPNPYLPQAVAGAFLTDDRAFAAWFLAGHLQIFANLERGIELAYENPGIEEAFAYESYGYALLQNDDDLVATITREIDNGGYIIVNVDAGPDGNTDQGEHQTRRLGICGYDGTRRIFRTISLNPSQGYEQAPMGYDALKSDYAKTKLRHIHSGKITQECALECFFPKPVAVTHTDALRKFLAALHAYLYPPRTCHASLRFGLGAMEEVATRLDAVAEDNPAMARRAMDFLVGHKLEILEKLRYIAANAPTTAEIEDLVEAYGEVYATICRVAGGLARAGTVTDAIGDLRGLVEMEQRVLSEVYARIAGVIDYRAPRQKILDLVPQTRITTYLAESLPLCVILADERVHPWFYQHYIQIYSRTTKMGHLYVSYHEPLGYYGDVLHEVWLTYDHLRGVEDIVSFLTEQVDRGCYLRVSVDEYYLSCKRAYNRSHFAHPSLVYGYDNDAGALLAVGFDADNLFGRITFGYDEFRAAFAGAKFYENKAHGDFWVEKKPVRLWIPKRFHREFPFNIRNFLRELHDYTFSIGDPTRFGYEAIMTERSTGRAKFGLDVYGDVIAHLGNLANGIATIDYRMIHLLAEHKKALHERLLYVLSRYGIEGRLASLVQDYQQVVAELERVRIIFGKETFRGFEKDTLAQISECLRHAKEREQLLLTEIVDLFTGHFGMGSEVTRS